MYRTQYQIYIRSTFNAINFICSVIYIRAHSHPVSKIIQTSYIHNKNELISSDTLIRYDNGEKSSFFPEWHDRMPLLKNKQHLYNSFIAQFFHRKKKHCEFLLLIFRMIAEWWKSFHCSLICVMSLVAKVHLNF